MDTDWRHRLILARLSGGGTCGEAAAAIEMFSPYPADARPVFFARGD